MRLPERDFFSYNQVTLNKMEDMSACTACSSKPLQGRLRAICFSSKTSLRALCKSTTMSDPMKKYK